MNMLDCFQRSQVKVVTRPSMVENLLLGPFCRHRMLNDGSLNSVWCAVDCSAILGDMKSKCHKVTPRPYIQLLKPSFIFVQRIFYFLSVKSNYRELY